MLPLFGESKAAWRPSLDLDIHRTDLAVCGAGPVSSVVAGDPYLRHSTRVEMVPLAVAFVIANGVGHQWMETLMGTRLRATASSQPPTTIDGGSLEIVSCALRERYLHETTRSAREVYALAPRPAHARNGPEPGTVAIALEPLQHIGLWRMLKSPWRRKDEPLSMAMATRHAVPRCDVSARSRLAGPQSARRNGRSE